VTEPHEARENIELAVLSTIVHAQNTDIALATCMALDALIANADMDDERFKLYFDVVMKALSESNPDLPETIMNSLGYEYQSDFARRYVAQGRTEGKTEGKAEGKAEGRMEGQIEMLLKLLALRFGPLSEPIQTLIRGLQDAQLDTVAERVLTAPTLEETLAPQD
jgi:predicted transposase YdaD